MRKMIVGGIKMGAAAVICTLVGCAMFAKPKESIILVKNGKTAAVIVLGAKATKSAQLGAYELQYHIKLITGAELPIVTEPKTDGVNIYVGDSEAVEKLGVDCSGFGKQEYLIKFFPNAIVLAGKDKQDFGKPVYDFLKNPRAVQTWPSLYDETGTMHAVYDFLTKYCGVKWINPTDFGTIVAKMKTLVVSGSDENRHPNMLYRGGSSGSDMSERYQLNGGFWKNGTKGAKKYNNLAYGDVLRKEKHPHRVTMGKRSQNRLFMYRMKAGGEMSDCNHSLYNYYERFWKKKNDNFIAHRPEYFAKGYKGDPPPQLCYGNDATVNQVVKDIRDYFDNGGYRKKMSGIGALGYKWGENFFALEPMDNTAFCKCEICKPQYEPKRKADRSEFSTYWFNFVNRVAREIKKSHPGKKISTLAYMTHEGLPTGFKMEDNVAVQFCISHNRMPYNTKALRKQLDRMHEWEKNEKVPMYLWLYNTFPLEVANNGNFYCFPGFFAHEAKRQYDIFDKTGIKGVFHCGYNGEVDNYVSYRLMDNPNQDVETLLDDYFTSYGKAGKPLKKMYELIEQRYCNVENYPKKSNGEPYTGHQKVGAAWEYLGNAETMAKLAEYMKEAYTLAETEQEKKLVQLWDDSLYSYVKAGREKYVERMSYPIPEVTAPKVANANGDANKVDWGKAASIGDNWYKCGGKEPAKLKLSGRICHDDKFLYLELVDAVDPKKLNVSPQIACYDDWEIFIAGQRAQPFRQYMVGPTALTCGISYGEMNWRQGVKATEYTKQAFGMRAVSDTKGGKWVLRLVFPLSEVLERPIKAGDDIYMNVMRVMSPKLAGKRPFGIDTWIAFTTVKDVDRLAKIHLE